MNLEKKNNGLFLIVSALLVGGLTYFCLDKKSEKAALESVDETVEAIAKETNQRPKSESELNATSRAVASIDKSQLQVQEEGLSTFAKREFTDPSQLLTEVEKISFQILNSELPMEKKSALNNELHNLTSQKMSKLSIPKVVDSKVDLDKNIVYPVYDK